MKTTELDELKWQSLESLNDQIDNDLLKAACEKMTDQEWEKLSDCTIEFIGKQLLTENNRVALHQNVDVFLQQMDTRLASCNE